MKPYYIFVIKTNENYNKDMEDTLLEISDNPNHKDVSPIYLHSDILPTLVHLTLLKTSTPSSTQLSTILAQVKLGHK